MTDAAGHMPSEETQPVSELLAEAIEDADLSTRKLARIWAGGKTATHQEVESRRRALSRYLAGTQPGDKNAEKLAELLGKPADYFKRREQNLEEQVAFLRAENATLSERVTKLAGEVAELRRRGQRRRRSDAT